MSIENWVRRWSGPPLNAVGRVLARSHLTPNGITLIGLLLTIGVAALAALGEIRWAGLAYIVASLCDSLDGTVARVTGRGSRFGAFLDSTVDRFEEALVFLGLAIHYAANEGRWEIPLILAATVASLMVSYTRARAEGLGVACKEGVMSRMIRILVMVMGMLLLQVVIALAIIAAGSLLTALHRVYHVWRMTGGERGGWGSVKEPYSPPSPSRPEPGAGGSEGGSR